jgi:hypothetical protein
MDAEERGIDDATAPVQRRLVVWIYRVQGDAHAGAKRILVKEKVRPNGDVQVIGLYVVSAL